MIDALISLFTSPFVILLILLAVGAIIWVAKSENTICNYCNADGEPCPMCGGSNL